MTSGSDERDDRVYVLRRVGDTTKHIRDFLAYATGREDHAHGVYYFAIIGAACLFESVLEEHSQGWCRDQSHEQGEFSNRLIDAILKDVSRATGLDAWKKWMRVLHDVDIVKVVGKDWRALDVLFVLRNQLAHGRTTKLDHYYSHNGKFLGMSIDGSSYTPAFRYLLDENVLAVPQGDVPSLELLLSASVARHFSGVVDRAINALATVPGLARLSRN
ncbi:MAG: hypothetical protein JNK76_06330 [Planctomycetales bacterium]|nr:hypothetical protein [Planctomycetales bacterium]